MKALVVDDSSTMRRILINTLSDGGITEVVQAMNGQEAVDAVASQPFDIVLMDWNMPVMTGIDALKEMRARGFQVPVIMVTTEAEKSRVLEALKSGASNYVIKPFQAADILEKIHKILNVGNPNAA